jgi:hypothetical protein
MRWFPLLVALFVVTSSAADRQWQTGKWVDAGINRNPLVADPRSGSPSASRIPSRPSTPEVARYVIETDETRYTVEDVVALGTSSFDLAVKIGERVTFAISKNTVYIRGDGNEYRLRLLKKDPIRGSKAGGPDTKSP